MVIIRISQTNPVQLESQLQIRKVQQSTIVIARRSSHRHLEEFVAINIKGFTKRLHLYAYIELALEHNLCICPDNATIVPRQLHFLSCIVRIERSVQQHRKLFGNQG